MKQYFIDTIIEDIRKHLPLQNPLSSFIHNNILMNFEHMKFEKGLEYASFYYGSRLFKDEKFYLDQFQINRIDEDELLKSINYFLENNKEFINLPKQVEIDRFYENLLLNPLALLKEENILWRIQNDTQNFFSEDVKDKEQQTLKDLVNNWLNDASEELILEILNEPELNDFPTKYLELNLKLPLKRQIQESNKESVELLILWCVCHVEAKKAFFVDCEHFEIRTYRRKKFFKKEYNEDFDNYTSPFLIRLLATFLDQGMSYWPNPYKEEGLFQFFKDFILATDFQAYDWMNGIVTILNFYKPYQVEEIIESELKLTNLKEQDWKDYILENLYDLRGWSGIVNRLEVDPSVVPVKRPNLNLKDLIAIKLILERVLNNHLSTKYSIKLTNDQLETYYKYKTTMLQNAYVVFHIMKHLALPIQKIIDFNENEIKTIVHHAIQFSDQIKTGIWHEAYEKTFYHKGLSSLYLHNKMNSQIKDITKDSQILFCIDDREESIRRHIEYIDNKVETLGVVGFFGLDMNFVSISHPRKLPHCPPVVKPITTIIEVANKISEEKQKFAQNNRHAFGKFILGLYFNSRTLLRAQIATFILGILSFIPLSFKIYHPVLARKIKKYFYKFLFPEIKTHLNLLSFENISTPRVGYTKKEMAERVATILKMMGLTKNLSPLIILMAHGSSSSNNPFQLAYGCGACSGRAGSPNSRAFAQMANDPEVRALLKDIGINISPDVYFLGAFHDTCTDNISYMDLDLLPETHKDIFQRVSCNLIKASQLNALERSRRFVNAKMKSPTDALNHVESRAFNIAEPRPEYGHSTVAMCVIGKRDLTKNLFMDRRSFLISYDPATDPEGEILLGVMAAAVPVCANISLDYFFSSVDSEKYGCGSKLPLNVTSLMGVMTGSSSDLRIGLAEQMVEIHEPMRIVIVYETTVEIMDSILSKSKKLNNLINNFWIRTVLIHPLTKEMTELTLDGWKQYSPKFNEIQNINDYFTYMGNALNSLDFARLEHHE
jgi:uncharacterized protein YbcC (UPF0753/DUF2309 family)